RRLRVPSRAGAALGRETTREQGTVSCGWRGAWSRAPSTEHARPHEEQTDGKQGVGEDDANERSRPFDDPAEGEAHRRCERHIRRRVDSEVRDGEQQAAPDDPAAPIKACQGVLKEPTKDHLFEERHEHDHNQRPPDDSQRRDMGSERVRPEDQVRDEPERNAAYPDPYLPPRPRTETADESTRSDELGDPGRGTENGESYEGVLAQQGHSLNRHR